MSDPCVKTLNSWTDVQTFLSCVVQNLGSGIASAPHGPFWETDANGQPMTYDNFVNGTIPHVSPAVPILVSGHPESSNIIMALNGTGPLFGPTGTYGQMPADGPPFFTTEQVNVLADWIRAECPEVSHVVDGGEPSSEPKSKG